MSTLPKMKRTFKVNDFLNPRSMLTPGVAGSIVMVIANTLWVEFMLPQKWTALTLSFILIVPILIKFSASVFENAIYFIFNGLIVFALAVNTNYAGRTIQNFATKDNAPMVTQLSDSLKSLAHNETSLHKNVVRLADNSSAFTYVTTTSDDDKAQDASKKKDKESKDKKEKDKDKDNRKFFGTWL